MNYYKNNIKPKTEPAFTPDVSGVTLDTLGFHHLYEEHAEAQAFSSSIK